MTSQYPSCNPRCRSSAERTPRPVVAVLSFAGRALEAVALSTILVISSTAGRCWAVEPWPQLPLPPQADVQWIAQSMRVNGVPTRVLQFQSRASRSEVADYYRAHWTGGYPHKASMHTLGEATIVGQVHGPYLLTLKVEDAPQGASKGLISVAQVVGSRIERNPGELPLMDGAHVVSVVESDDPGKHSREVLVVTPQAPSTVNSYYEAS